MSAADVTETSPSVLRDRLATFFAFLSGLGVVALLFGELAASRWWVGELCVSFRPHLALSVLVASVLVLVLRRFAGIVLAVLAAVVALLPLNPKAHVVNGGADELTFLSANVLGHANHDVDTFLALVERSQPDVIGIVEVSEVWEDALENGLEAYPYRTIIDRPDNFGIAVLSRYPYTRRTFAEEPPMLDIDVDADGVSWRVIIAHPVPPIGAEWWQRRNARLQQIADRVQGGERTVVLGDLNTPASSPTFRHLLRSAGLTDPRPHYDGTFPARLGRFGITLDYVLATTDVGCVEYTVLEDIGSDHRPVLATMR